MLCGKSRNLLQKIKLALLDLFDFFSYLVAFLELICDVLYPINPILSFLLSGQDIVLFDELKLQGEDGYSRGIVALLEALGLDQACMSQADFDKYVYGQEVTDVDALAAT